MEATDRLNDCLATLCRDNWNKKTKTKKRILEDSKMEGEVRLHAQETCPQVIFSTARSVVKNMT